MANANMTMTIHVNATEVETAIDQALARWSYRDGQRITAKTFEHFEDRIDAIQRADHAGVVTTVVGVAAALVTSPIKISRRRLFGLRGDGGR